LPLVHVDQIEHQRAGAGREMDELEPSAGGRSAQHHPVLVEPGEPAGKEAVGVVRRRSSDPWTLDQDLGDVESVEQRDAARLRGILTAPCQRAQQRGQKEQTESLFRP